MRFEIRQSKRNKQWRAYFISDGNNEKIWFTEQYVKLVGAKSAVALIDKGGNYPVYVYDFSGKLKEQY